jgi:hypothetical protein
MCMTGWRYLPRGDFLKLQGVGEGSLSLQRPVALDDW